MTDPYRLPSTVTPSHYELELAPDLAAATFAGTVAIDVEVHEATAEVVLNAIELEIDVATVDGIAATVTLHEADERATLRLPAPVGPGSHKVVLHFRGILNDKLHGFYRSVFTDPDGAEHTIATTQFEATDARRCFPCWDEPIHKATFAIALVVDDDLLAVSNAAEVGREPAGEGKVRVRFATTMKMSTYLVAFVVGPLDVTEAIDVDGVPLRVVAPAHRMDLTPFALEVGAAALRYFTAWFALPYPGDKLDLVAIPDFAFGAMENLGCVTFRETALLLDPSAASQAEAQRVADVINHEIAHMWFGDLVTMKWWNGIWLNEAFATFMELKATDDLKPEWDRWTAFGVERGAAYQIDSLASTRAIEFPVVSPAEAEGMFDALTYQKGCAVMRMLEQYLGEDAFREGLRHYMQVHGYRNTETADLWDALEHASSHPVRAVMDSWILQGGHPVVSVAATADGRGLVFDQERFGFTDEARDDRRWSVPLLLRVSVDGGVRTERLLLEGATATLELGGSVDWVVANAGGWGFYRTRLSTPLRDALVAAPQDVVALTALEQHSMAADTWAAVVGGYSTSADLAAVAAFLSAFDADPDVWSALATGFGALDRIAEGEARDVLARFVRTTVRPVLERIGWEPVAGESARTGMARGVLLQLLGTAGADEDARRRAHDLLTSYLVDRTWVAADLLGAAVTVSARTADERVYEALLDRFRHPATPQEEARFLQALALVEDPELAARTVELSFTDEVRSQNAPMLLMAAVANRVNGAAAWQTITRRWDEVTKRFPTNLQGRIVGGLAVQTDAALSDAARAFLAEHPLPQAKNQVAQALEGLRVNVALAEREGPGLADALGG